MRTLNGLLRHRRRCGPKWLCTALAGAVALLLSLGTARAQSAATEYQIKALFLLNFMRFVDWPPTALPDASTPLVVGTVGDNPFGPLLREAFSAERVRGRTLIVKELGPGDDPSQCHLLFISRSERERLPGILPRLTSAPTLTVSEFDRFCEQGGMINLVTQEDSIRFEINPEAANRAGLHVSAKLLNLARRDVHEPPSRATPSP